MTAIRADTLLGGKIDELLTDRQSGIIAPLGSVVLRLLTPFSLRLLGVVLGIVQVIGAIHQRLGLAASAEKIGLELPLFTFELLDFLLECGVAEQGIAMATLPISDLLAELEILASQALDFGANSTTSRLEFSTGSINSGEEPLGQQTCTSWPLMTNLVYRNGRDLGRGEFPFIHCGQTCTDGIGEALHGITGNFPSLLEFREGVRKLWQYWLSRRRRAGRMTWPEFLRLERRYALPKARVVHGMLSRAAT